jgi:hypothetical protein
MPLYNPFESALRIIWPTRAEMRKGLARIENFLPSWKVNPALLVIKPQLGLIVALQSLKHDKHGFALGLKVDQALVAPPGFETRSPMTLECVWNQPYLSMAIDYISAPYNFYLHFGIEGVQRARELNASIRDKGVSSEMMPGLLRSCFSSNFGGPEAAAR